MGQYEYECDERGNRVVLGEGRFGTVYAGFNYETQVKIAIKEIPTINNELVLMFISFRKLSTFLLSQTFN